MTARRYYIRIFPYSQPKILEGKERQRRTREGVFEKDSVKTGLETKMNLSCAEDWARR